MKLNIMNDIESTLEDSQQFAIKASPKAFKILSSNLYSNKIRAIIRELSCNALDSHIEAKQDKPFIVHIPTSINPYFYVKDFGVGLSNDDIMHLYITYFDSSKNNSNEFIGALGLGSKSPFSYTDSFMVESIYNHEKNTYVMYINEQGYPSINHLENKPTDEHNGVMIKFNVKSEDFKNFINEAKYVLSVFDKNKFELTGSIDNECLYKELIFNENNYCVLESCCYNEHLYAYMGNILYPIDIEQLSDILEIEEVNFFQHFFMKFAIKFNIGDLDISPSRETLSYNKDTKNILKNNIRKLLDDFINYIIEKQNICLDDKLSTAQILNSLNEYLSKIIIIKLDLLSDDIYAYLYDKKENKFIFNTNKLLQLYKNKDDIKKLNIYSLCTSKKGRYYACNENNTNILRYVGKEFYLSHNPEGKNRFRFCGDTENFLIEVRFINRNQKNIEVFYDFLKNIFKHIDYAENLLDKTSVKFYKDMNFMTFGRMMDKIHCHAIKVFTTQQISEKDLNNDGLTFYLSADNDQIYNQSNYFILNILNMILSDKIKRKIKIYLTRKKMNQYVKDKNIPNLINFGCRLLHKKHFQNKFKKILNEIELEYKKSESRYSGFIEDLLCLDDKVNFLDDKKLCNDIKNYRYSYLMSDLSKLIYNRNYYSDICKFYGWKESKEQFYDNNDNIYTGYYDFISDIQWPEKHSKEIIEFLNYIYHKSKNVKNIEGEK